MQSGTVLKDLSNALFQEAIEGIFPPCDASTNLKSGLAAVSPHRAKFIRGAATGEGERLSILLRGADDQPTLRILPPQPGGDPTAEVQRDSLPDIGLR
jgi:hypothetical protein